jgi:hypothetical protein
VNVELTLHLESSADAPQVIVNLLPSDGIGVVSGKPRWIGAMSKGQVLELPFVVQVVANGDWTIGASVSNKRPDGDQVSGAVVHVRARNGAVTFTTDAPSAR